MKTYKMALGGRYVNIQTVPSDNDSRLELSFGFNREINDLIKSSFDGWRWEPVRKKWTIANSERNDFRLRFMSGEKVLERYQLPVVNQTLVREVRAHQRDGIAWVMSRRHCILAWEMGVGKTLIAITCLEEMYKLYPANFSAWYVAPKSVIAGIKLELKKWSANIPGLELLTYDELKKTAEQKNVVVPRAIIFDESSMLKTPTSQRTVACAHVARSVRFAYGYESLILLMTGTPSPKSPEDWWSQAEIARPGYLKEGGIQPFRARYAFQSKMENQGGQVFDKVNGWKCNASLCNTCGQLADNHSGADHEWTVSQNEVANLHLRLTGLVSVKLKKDCVDLPAKTYVKINVVPTKETLRAASLIRHAKNAAQQLLALCQLSDGFQYKEVEGAPQPCEICHGKKEEFSSCELCAGAGTKKTFVRESTRIACPKDDALIDLLSTCDTGRMVIYGRFTETVDRITDLCNKAGWSVIRVDGRGCQSKYGALQESLSQFQSDNQENIAFVAQPDSAGMGITLTKSDTIVYYSNSFKGESRMQSEDRIHRMGMSDKAVIVDLIHLPVDEFVLGNIKYKRNLQNITMGELDACMLHLGN